MPAADAPVAVVGPGAIGAAVAAAVDAAGGPVLLCGRTPLDSIAVVPDDGEPHLLEGPVLTDPAGLGPVPWVLLAVKAQQVEGARQWLAALAGPGSRVLVLQNGVEQEQLVAPLAGGAEVIPSVVWFPAESPAPGRVLVHGEPRIHVRDDEGGRAFAALAAATTLRVEARADYAEIAWRKLTINAVIALTVLVGGRAGIFQREDVAALGREFAAECLAVARAEGAELGPEVAAEIVAELQSLPPGLGSSITIDYEQGRPLEWEARNGVISRLGARHGIPTPISDVVVPLLAAASERGAG